jgi:hypothetical protein
MRHRTYRLFYLVVHKPVCLRWAISTLSNARYKLSCFAHTVDDIIRPEANIALVFSSKAGVP